MTLTSFELAGVGAAESGKSTVFKQMSLAHGVGFSEKERAAYRPVIYGNIVDAIQVLLRHVPEIPESLQSAYALLDKVQVDEHTETVDTISPEVWDAIEFAWKNEEVQKLYLERSQIQLKEATA